MKRWVGLNALLCVLMAQAQNDARLHSADGSLFRAYLNEKALNKTPEASVMLRNVVKDTLYLKIEFANKQKLGITIYLLDKGKKTTGKEFDYKISPAAEKIKVAFTGMYDALPLPSPLVPPKLAPDTGSMYKNTVLGNFCELKNGTIVYFNNRPKTGTCSSPMPPEHMAFISFLMSKANQEKDRIKIAENTCYNNCMSLEQLEKLIGYVSYELEKLNILRLGFANLVDTTTKNRLARCFRFDASVAEMNAFFRNPSTYSRVGGSGGCHTASGNEEMIRFINELAALDNDTRRMEVVKKNFNRYCYSVDQAMSLLEKFLHDREKLETAKLLYLNCVEKEKFMNVSPVFSFRQSGVDLGEYIDKQGK